LFNENNEMPVAYGWLRAFFFNLIIEYKEKSLLSIKSRDWCKIGDHIE
jgi:hypothetical protein